MAVRLLTLTAALLLAGCGTTAQTPSPQSGPKVVATTSWEAGFAKAAGATDVTVIVPKSVLHAPDYDPKPSDLKAVAGADYVLYAPFESFATKITDAAGSNAKKVEVALDNSRDKVKAEVTRLGELFGTQAAVAGLLTSLPVTVLVVTHDRAVVQRCERVLEMAAGTLREIT